jgi:hypothetical protein
MKRKGAQLKELICQTMKSKANTLFKMAPFTKGSGKIGRDMGMESRYGQMVQDMKVSGNSIKPLEKVYSIMLTEIYLMDNGNMIKLMASEPTIMLTAVSMKANGLTIFKMEKVKKRGKMGQLTKVAIKKGKSTVRVYMFGAMVVFTTVNGSVIKYKELELINGLMVAITKESGLKTKCMEMVI